MIPTFNQSGQRTRSGSYFPPYPPLPLPLPLPMPSANSHRYSCQPRASVSAPNPMLAWLDDIISDSQQAMKVHRRNIKHHEFIHVNIGAEGWAPIRDRIAQACGHCRHKKSKCSGGSPCERCTKFELECVYGSKIVTTSKPRGPTKARLEARLKWADAAVAAIEENIRRRPPAVVELPASAQSCDVVAPKPVSPTSLALPAWAQYGQAYESDTSTSEVSSENENENEGDYSASEGYPGLSSTGSVLVYSALPGLTWHGRARKHPSDALATPEFHNGFHPGTSGARESEHVVSREPSGGLLISHPLTPIAIPCSSSTLPLFTPPAQVFDYSSSSSTSSSPSNSSSAATTSSSPSNSASSSQSSSTSGSSPPYDADLSLWFDYEHQDAYEPLLGLDSTDYAMQLPEAGLTESVSQSFHFTDLGWPYVDETINDPLDAASLAFFETMLKDDAFMAALNAPTPNMN